MRIYIEADELKAALSIASKAGRECRVTITDSQMQAIGEGAVITQQLVCNVDTSGTACVAMKALTDAVRRVVKSGTVLLANTGKKLKVESNRSSVSVGLLEAGAVDPDLGDELAAIQTPAHTLCAALEAVSYAICTDDTRYGLNGLCFRGGSLMASDGHRASVVPLVESGDAPKSLVSRESCAAIIAALKACGAEDEATLTLRDGWHRLEVPGITMDLRALDGEFPDMSGILPSPGDAPKVTAHREALADALATVHLRADKATRVDVKDGSMVLTGSSYEDDKDARSEIPCEGDVADFAVNAGYLGEALSHIDAESVSLEMRHAQAPMLVSWADMADGQRVVIMPMRRD